MKNEKKTVRLVYPQWQGGVNPDYVFGSRLLAFLAPGNTQDETVEIPVTEDFETPLAQVDGVDGGDVLLSQMEETSRILKEKDPDHVIVFGGDCAVSQRPFDFLRGKYGENMGIIWMDAHPDIATVKTSSHLHEMVLGNLIGLGGASEVTRVEHPVEPEKVIFAGLIEPDLREMDMAVRTLSMAVAGPEKLAYDSAPVLDWIRKNHIAYVAVHFDLDVLTPVDFRSIYPAEPYCRDFGAAIGALTLKQVGRILQDVSGQAELVGLTVAEHLPWDAFRLREMLAGIPIFGNKGGCTET